MAAWEIHDLTVAGSSPAPATKFYKGTGMSYSRQVCNGTTVENIDGKIFVNGYSVETGKPTKFQQVINFCKYIVVFCLGIAFQVFTGVS